MHILKKVSAPQLMNQKTKSLKIKGSRGPGFQGIQDVQGIRKSKKHPRNPGIQEIERIDIQINKNYIPHFVDIGKYLSKLSQCIGASMDLARKA